MRSDPPLSVAMLAPPWIPVPAPGYGGTEEVVRLLCEGLVERGHRVTLFAPPQSQSPAEVRPVLEAPFPDSMHDARVEADHVARAFAAIEDDGGFDLIHDHCAHVALAMADRVAAPVVHTVHLPFSGPARAFYRVHGRKAQLVALSRHQRAQAPPEAGELVVVPNPLRVDEWPFRADKEGFLLWIGRMSPDKGPHRAIAAARRAGARLVLAGPVQPGQQAFFAEAVEPHVDGDAVRYVGEADGRAKRDLYARARAMLMPIRWPEPFGLVMLEAMACGTPVIAFPEGAAPELVRDGETGFVVEDEAAMAAAIGRLDRIDPARCRALVDQRFGVETVVERYEAVYRGVVASRPSARPDAAAATVTAP